MSWFKRQRQDFIRAQLAAFGQIRRKDIAERFEVSVQVASADINEWIDTNPDAIIYDGRAKMYVLDCDSGSDRNGEDPKRSVGAECEASQSGGEAASPNLPHRSPPND